MSLMTMSLMLGVRISGSHWPLLTPKCSAQPGLSSHGRVASSERGAAPTLYIIARLHPTVLPNFTNFSIAQQLNVRNEKTQRGVTGYTSVFTCSRLAISITCENIKTAAVALKLMGVADCVIFHTEIMFCVID